MVGGRAGADTVGGRRKRRKLRRRQAEEAGNNSTADGRRKRRELRQTAGKRVGNYVRWQVEEAKVTRKLRRHGRRKRGSYGRRIRQGWIYGGRRRWRMIRWAKREETGGDGGGVTMAAADLAVAETVVAGSAVRAEAATDAAMAAAASRELRQMVVR